MRTTPDAGSCLHRNRRPARAGVALVALLTVAGGAAGCVGSGGARATAHAASTGRSTATTTPSAASSAATTSARLVPTSNWMLGKLSSHGEIEGFAGATSVLPGQPVSLYVSTTAASYTIHAFRLGAYENGDNAAAIWSSASLPGRRQAPAVTIPATRTPYAPWQPSVTVPTKGWPAGAYVFRLDADTGWQNLVPLTVRSRSAAGTVVLMNAVTTWQAYNHWGGRSLYAGPNGSLATRAYAVSFDRPYDFGAGAADLLGNELPLISLAERLRLRVSYVTDIDLDTDPALLTGARALISLGHDEYWSQAMRDNAARARDAGTNLAFLGANADYRHIRLAPTPLGPNRLEIDYKSFDLDPVSATDPAAATTWSWDTPPFPRPSSSLTGGYYQCNPVRADLVPADASSWLLQGLVQPGEHVSGLVGGEYDRVNLAAPTPRPMQILFHSPVTCVGTHDYADVTYYTAPSGAAVFDSGTSSWVCALVANDCADGRGNAAADAVVTGVTTRLLEAFAAGPAGREHPARDNVDALPGTHHTPSFTAS